MVALISDLHITDENTASNVDPGALRLMGREILESACQHGADELHLILLGDVFDVVRTDYWHCKYKEDLSKRPWHGTRDPRTGMNTDPIIETDFNIILDRILVTKASLALRDMVEKLAGWCNEPTTEPTDPDKPRNKIHFKLTYVIANHDRVLNNFASLKNKIIAFWPTNFGGFNFENKVHLQDYGLLARHGHEWDYDCYGINYLNNVLAPGPKVERFHSNANDVIGVGEAVTAEVMAGLVYYARQTLKGKLSPALYDDVIWSVREVNNLRPLGAVPDWLKWISKKYPQAEEPLLEALQKALNNFFKTRLVAEWPDDGGVCATMGKLRDHYFGNFWQKGMVIVGAIGDGVSGLFSREQEPLLAGAEKDFPPGVQYVVYGHTHTAQQYCFLDKGDGDFKLYVNSGTMLPIIEQTLNAAGKTTDSFTTSYAMTLVFFYRGSEDTSGRIEGNNTATMEYWDGRRRKVYKLPETIPSGCPE